MFIYYPTIDSTDRVIHYGGESTQLHYEVLNPDKEWYELAVRTLGAGLPKGMSEMHAELQDFYNYCQVPGNY